MTARAAIPRRLTWASTLAALALFALVRSATAQEDRRPPSEIRTSATARRFVQPDLAIVKLSFSAKRDTPEEAGEALAARADSLRRALGRIGIPNDSMITASRWYWWRGRIETVRGSRCLQLPETTPDGRSCIMVNDTTYRAHDAIELHVHGMRSLAAALDTAMAHHVTDISEIQFRATDVGAAYEDALKEAATTARRQADAMAAASGARLGRIILLSTYSESSPPELRYRPAGPDAMTMDTPGPGTTIVQPSIPVVATVYARWELVEQP